MNIAFEGCCHGELNKIYDQISYMGKDIDLVLIGGDFQAVRNEQDLNCMSVPPKYLRLADFHEYYSGARTAPYLTIFIGGNHEASNYLEELRYGGWVAPNIYYLGRAGVVRFGGLRIGGISGIYKDHHYNQPRLEKLPYHQGDVRSVYHVRKEDVANLQMITGRVDAMISHDWPCGIVDYGDKKGLLQIKRHLATDVNNGSLGSPPCMELLRQLRPLHWFSAHLHVRFEAAVQHGKINEDEIEIDVDIDDDGSKDEERYSETRFLALDKCLPKRKCIEVMSIGHQQNKRKRDEPHLEYDSEWLSILRAVNKCKQNKKELTRDDVLREQKEYVSSLDLMVPQNFTATVPTQQELEMDPNYAILKKHQPKESENPQTARFCEFLGIS